MASDQQPLHKKQQSPAKSNTLPQEPLPARKKCGSYHVYKALSIIYAIIFILIGVLLTGLAVWMLMVRQEYQFVADVVLGPALLLLIAGVIIITTALLGCVGASCDKLWPLRIFLGIVILVFILQVVVGILAYIYREETIDEFKKRAEPAIEEYSEANDSIKRAVDKAQQYWKCCGLDDYQDWERNKDYKCHPQALYDCSVPESCCVRESKDCGRQGLRLKSSNIKKNGCVKSFKMAVETNLDIIGATALAMAIIHILGIFVVYMYITKVEDRIRLFKYRKRFYN